MPTENTAKDLTAKKLPCGGYAIFGTDSKKNLVQIGYVSKIQRGSSVHYRITNSGKQKSREYLKS